MIEARDIKRIKTAQRAAGMSDKDYRAMLRERFHVVSCKELVGTQVGECVHAIKDSVTRQGWAPAQLDRFDRYRQLIGWDNARARVEVQAVTGRFNELAPTLTNADFDRVMQVMEQALEAHIRETGGAWPPGMQPRYWRTRNAGCNRRLVRKMTMLWEQLCEFLAEDKRTDDYLCGIVAKATGYPCKSRYGWQTYQVMPTIDALTDRLAYARGDG
jgi:hypothetical protein